ncbi:histidine--tRNA ligase [Pseudotenacibaculum haliotis]|uniref:Histidine--tRNA ligase n=1 Tax=Pseudotenacibaculum haliotis TaxID=1862138 RepID=A0ABW5LXH1_9FLAO
MKPSIPKGTRDFSSTEVANRTYIMNTIRAAFETYGFQPIETPTFENSSTLMGKYGEEGDRLIFKILNSGDYLAKVDENLLASKESNKVTAKISEKALRYDLTVPFARYVVQHQNEITFPFKRYQIQPVWRADRPQKGRFREFYQCDADVVGSKSLLQEVEFVQLYDEVFTNLGLKGTTIKMNNRKILSGIAEVIGAKDKLIDFTVALDKLDKIGEDGVIKEMLSKGISEEAIENVKPLFQLSGSNTEQLDVLANLLSSSEEGKDGVEELRSVVNTIADLGLQSATLTLDVTLARGLNYYTGAIFEVAAPEGVKMGSIGGGGRYDDLTGIFGLKDVSGVGISFGLDRIYLVLEELGLFEAVELPKPKVLFLNFNEEDNLQRLKAVQALRREGIKSEIYPDTATSNNQQKKQWKYADKRAIPFVISEIENDQYVLKDRVKGEQRNCTLEQLIVETK